MGDVYKNRKQILNKDVSSLQKEYLTFVNKIEQIEYIEKKYGPAVTKKKSGLNLPSIYLNRTSRESSSIKERGGVATSKVMRHTFLSETEATYSMQDDEPIIT
jgi:hypothetical protein